MNNDVDSNGTSKAIELLLQELSERNKADTERDKAEAQRDKESKVVKRNFWVGVTAVLSGIAALLAQYTTSQPKVVSGEDLDAALKRRGDSIRPNPWTSIQDKATMLAHESVALKKEAEIKRRLDVLQAAVDVNYHMITEYKYDVKDQQNQWNSIHKLEEFVAEKELIKWRIKKLEEPNTDTK